MSKSQVVRASLTQEVIKKYETTERVLEEFLENDDFVTRYLSTTILEEDFENGLESIEDGLEGGNDHRDYEHLKKLGIKEFGKRAEKAIKKIKANDDPINIADLKIFEHLSGHRKIAGDLIRELRDGTLVEDGEFENAQGFVQELSSFRRALFPGDLEFTNKITAVSEELTETANNYSDELRTQLIKYSIFRELGTVDGDIVTNKAGNHQASKEWTERYDKVRIIMEDVSKEIRMPSEEEWKVLLGYVSEPTDPESVRSKLIDIIEPKVAVKNKLIPEMHDYALNKLKDVVEESKAIRNELNKYLENNLGLSGAEFQEAQYVIAKVIAKLEKNGGRKDNLLSEEWDVILKKIPINPPEERQHAKEMVRAYIIRSERAVDQFIAQRGNINVRNDKLRALDIDPNGEAVKNVLAKLEAVNEDEITAAEWKSISEGVKEDELGDFQKRMLILSNNNYIDRSREITQHQEKIGGILKRNFEDVKTEIKKLSSLSGMVDNLTEDEWKDLLQKVPENKDIAREEIIQLVRDFEETLDENAQPEYRKFPIASDITLIDDYAAIEIQRVFRGFKERKKIPNRKESAAAKVVDEDKNKKASIDEMIEKLTARVALLEAEKKSDKAEIKKLQDVLNDLKAITTEQLKVNGLDDISSLSEEINSGISNNSLGRSSRSTSSTISSKGFFPLNGGNEGNNSEHGIGLQGVGYNPISSDRQRQNPFSVRYNGWTQEQQLPFININVPGYGVGGYGDPSNIGLLLAQQTEGLKKEIEDAKAAVLKLEASAIEATEKAQKEIEDVRAANQKLIEANQKKIENQTAANKKAHDDKMAEMAEMARKEKEAKEREEKRKEAMESDWHERNVSYEDLEKIGHLSDGDGLAVISEIRGQKKGKLGEEGYFPGMTTYRNGSSVAVYDGKKGLERFTREVEQSAAKEWSGKDGNPVASIARIDNLEKEGDSVFCLATASPSGTTKTFISPEIYQAKINIIADEEYEMALSSAVRIDALTKYVAALKKAAEKLQNPQDLIPEDSSYDGSVLSNDDDEVGRQLSDWEADFTDNESRLSDPNYSPKEEIKNKIDRIEEVLNNMNAVYKGRKEITREDKRQYLEDMRDLDPMDSSLIDFLKEKDEKLGKKLERLENSVFTTHGISTLKQDATRVQKEFARLYSAQETNRSVGDMVEKSAQRNKLSVDLDSQEVEKLSNEFAMRQRGKGARVASNIFVPWNVVKGMKQAFDPGKGAYETLLEQPIQHAPLEGISILRPRGTGNIATVCFEGNARKDIAYLYVPETDYIISVRRAKNTGKVASYEGGPMVDCVANEIIIPKDTVFKLVDGKHVAVPLASLSKRDREFYDNFQVKAMSNVDGQRKMTTLFKGEVRQYNDLDKKIAYDIDSDQVIKFEVTGTDGPMLDKKIEGAEKTEESYVIKIGSIPDQFGNTLVNLKGVLVADKNNKGGLVIQGPYIEQEDGTKKLLDKQSLKELYKDLGVINPKHQKTFAEITREVRQTKVMATIVKDGQEHVVKLPITDGVTPSTSTVVKEASIAGQIGHIVQNPVMVGPKGGRGPGG